MQEIMEFETVSELLELDARDEKRNRMLLGAVSEAICLYLDRNLLLGTTTESLTPYDSEITPHEYPIRRIDRITAEITGNLVNLATEVNLPDITRPDSHRQKPLKLEKKIEGVVRITYQYGYEPNELPQLIQATILDMLRDRIIMYGKGTSEEIRTMDKDRLMNITPYRRIYYR